MKLKYYQVDAFAEPGFLGNPAGVCLLNEWPRDPVLQAIAAENGLSETAFVVNGTEETLLRWFTPKQEVPLCGHATLAAASVVLRGPHDSVNFRTPSGRVRAQSAGEWIEIDLPAVRRRTSTEVPEALLAGIPGAEPAAVFQTYDDPNYLVILPDETSVRQLVPRLSVLESLHPHGVGVSAPGALTDFVCRYFAPSYGIPEDPVTGSLHCALAPYWADRLGRWELISRQLSPRGGLVRCRVSGDRVMLSGKVVRYLEGEIEPYVKA